MSDRSEELNSKYEDGFYWVKTSKEWLGGGEWEVARFYYDSFNLTDGMNESFPAIDFDEIGPRIPSPDEASQSVNEE